jgi:hypothetical protein
MSTDPERQDAAMESEMERSAQTGEQSGIDPLSWFSWALILIWAGFVLMFKNMGEALGVEPENASAWILTGAGVVFWLEAILRLAIPKYQWAVGERVILGMVFVIVGLGEVVEMSLWPLLLVAIGVAIMVGFFSLPRHS